MSSAPRLPVDALDVNPPPTDEELPDYEDEAAPEYDRELHETPLHRYYLRQMDRKLLMVVPYGPSAPESYRIASRGARLFSKRPEVEVWRTSRAPTADAFVAGIWFDIDGPLPWRPRARFIQNGTQGAQTYAMESRNFSDWTLSLDGTTYVWMLEARPFSMVFRVVGSRQVIARFNFSAQGTTATGGAEAGDLIVYRDRLSADSAGVEKILCSLVTAVTQFRKMGRHYKNDPAEAPLRAASLPGDRVPLHRTGAAQFWSYSGEV